MTFASIETIDTFACRDLIWQMIAALGKATSLGCQAVTNCKELVDSSLADE